MHEQFKIKFKELSLTMAEVEAKIECPQNYLSRFINGPASLPNKWAIKIQGFIDGIEKQLAAQPVKNPDLLRPWIKIIEDYCKSAGIDPETLVEDHKLAKSIANQPKPRQIPQKDTSPTPAPSNWLQEYRKKKLGIKD